MQVQPEAPERVGFDGRFELAAAPTLPEQRPGKKQAKAQLKQLRKRLRKRQRVFAADARHALLIILQGMDASGKDSAVRSVMRGVNPAGCQVWSFKQPSEDELAHDFLWRSTRRLPGCGNIGVFNRSYYEEVLVTRVHPQLLERQCLNGRGDAPGFWEGRYRSIREHEAHLARSGTIILKFWLNISREEQRRRFLRRIDKPHKHWKFSAADIEERRHWGRYMAACQAALQATSRECAPWYAIPADDKPYARLRIASIIVDTLEALDLRYPQPDAAEAEQMRRLGERLREDGEP